MNNPNQMSLKEYGDIEEKPNSIYSFFSGMGGLDLGFENAGFNITIANELDKPAADIMQSNMPSTHIIRDSIHRISHRELLQEHGRPGVVIGGFPCTPYSSIASLHNNRLLDSQGTIDYRRYAKLGGELFLHYVRMVAYLQPRAFVVENVMDLVGMQIIMESLKDLPCTRNGDKFGKYYNITYTNVNTKDFGLPQDRKRLFVVGLANQPDERPLLKKRPLATRHVTGDLLEEEPNVPGLEGTHTLSKYFRQRLNGEYRDRPIIRQNAKDEIAPTCLAHYYSDQSTRMVEREKGIITPYSVREYARLQGFPDSWEIPHKNSSYKAIGNAVSVPVAQAIAEAIRPLVI